MNDRYAVYVFPNAGEEPWLTRWWTLAWIWAGWRSLTTIAEVRLIDQKTNKHWVF